MWERTWKRFFRDGWCSETPFRAFALWVSRESPHFLALLAGDGTVLLILPGITADLEDLDFADLTDLGAFLGVPTFFFDAVFFTAVGLFVREAAGFLAAEGAVTFSSSLDLLAATGALRGGFTSTGFTDFGALGDLGTLVGLATAAPPPSLTALDRAPLAVLLFTRLEAFFATLVGLWALISLLLSLMAIAALGALTGFLSSSESLKEFLTL